jgi:alcohol dehydrogenase class IV
LEGDRLHAFRLARRALPLALAEPDNPAPRIDLCAAALLANRGADDDAGGRTDRDPIHGASYALATALHLRYHHVGQGEATAALTPTVVRAMGDEDPETAMRLADALDVWEHGMTASEANAASAGALTDFYSSIGMPARVRDLGIPRNELAAVAGDTIKNFNANAGLRSDEQAARSLALLEAAW